MLSYARSVMWAEVKIVHADALIGAGLLFEGTNLPRPGPNLCRGIDSAPSPSPRSPTLLVARVDPARSRRKYVVIRQYDLDSMTVCCSQVHREYTLERALAGR
jgi:hypothetical protein